MIQFKWKISLIILIVLALGQCRILFSEKPISQDSLNLIFLENEYWWGGLITNGPELWEM